MPCLYTSIKLSNINDSTDEKNINYKLQWYLLTKNYTTIFVGNNWLKKILQRPPLSTIIYISKIFSLILLHFLAVKILT